MQKRHYQLLLALIIVVGALLRLHHLDSGSFSFDESYSALTARATIGQIVKRGPYEANPPFGPIMYRIWTDIFGRSEFSFETLSALLGSLSLLAAALVANYCFGKPVALFTCFFMALSVFHLHYSQQVRVYAAAVLAIILSAFFFLRFIEKKKMKDAALFLAATLLAMNLHYFSLFIFFPFAIYGLWCSRNWSEAGGVFLLFSVLGLFYLPTLYALFLQYFRFSTIEGVPPPSIHYVAALYDKVHGGSAILAPLYINLFLWGLLTVIRRTEKTACYLFAVLWCFLPLILVFGLSLIGKSIFLPRYFILVFPAYLMLVAYGADALPKTWMKIIVVILVLAGNISPLKEYYQERIESAKLKRACHYVADHYQPGDLVLHTLKFSFSPCIYYNDYTLEEYYITSSKWKNIFQHWYERPVEIDMDQALRYNRVWFCAPNSLSDKAVDGVLNYPPYLPRKPKLEYRSKEGNLVLISFEKHKTDQ